MSDAKRKKILYLMEFPIDLPGGGQLSTQTLCEGLNGDEFETVAVCPTLLTKRAKDYSFRVVTYFSDENREKNRFLRIANFLRRIGSFYRIIRRERPDLIHVSMSESLITFGFLRCLGIFRRIPFLYTDRGLAYGYRKHSLSCILSTMKYASRMITTTHFNEALWKERNLNCEISVIPNTIGSAFDSFEEEKRVQQRRIYGVGEDAFVVGFAGRISEEKDWDLVPILVQALKAQGLCFKVALVISVYEEGDSAYVSELKQRIIQSIGEENLIYRQDLSQKEIADYYYLVDVFVMSSMFESFGKAAVEAMSRKCAVLSTSVGGLREVIGKEENLYAKEDLGKFVLRMEELKNSPEKLNAERDYFYHRYLENFTRSVHLNRHRELYLEILRNRNAGRLP